jgi:hypothetical protein
MFEKGCTRAFRNKEKIFAVRVSGEPVDPMQGKGTAPFVGEAFPKVVHDFGRAAVEAKRRQLAVDHQRTEFFLYFRQDTQVVSALSTPRIVYRGPSEKRENKKKSYRTHGDAWQDSSGMRFLMQGILPEYIQSESIAI